VTIAGKIETIRGEGNFAVSPRTWTVYQITNPTHVYDLVSPMIAAPDSAHQTYGATDLTKYRTDSTSVTVISSGPNRGLAFFMDQVPFDGNTGYICLHPALYPPSAGHGGSNPDYARWYNDQNGQGTGTCTAAGMAILAAEAERHEGVTVATDSHIGVANRELASFRLHERVESLVRPGEAKLRDDATRLYDRWRHGAFVVAQAQFDNVDRPKVFAKIGCTLDLITNDAH